MNPKLYVKLFEKIQEFVTESCESDEWARLDAYWPDDGEGLMADAASSVFDAIVASSKFTEEQTKQSK